MARSYNPAFGLYPALRLNFCARGPAQGRLCAPVQSAFPPSMAVRQPRIGFNLTKKPARAAATLRTQRLPTPKKTTAGAVVLYPLRHVAADLSAPYRHSTHRRHTTTERTTSAHWAAWSPHTTHGTHHFAHAAFGGHFFHHFLHL